MSNVKRATFVSRCKLHHRVAELRIRKTQERRSAPPSRRLYGMAATAEAKMKNMKRQQPACVVFDLDGCLWSPEMYELSWMGSGPPFSPRRVYKGKGGGGGGKEEEVMVSRRGDEVRLLGDVREVLRELHCSPKWQGTRVGISSRCDEPDWA